MCLSLAYSQVKVVTNGRTKVGVTGSPPLAQLHVESPDVAVAQFTGTNTGQTRINILRQSSNTLLNVGISSGSITNNFGYFWSQSGKFMIANDNAGRPTFLLQGMNNGTVSIAAISSLVDMTAKLHVDGKVVKPGGGDWDAPSDKRLKSNIKDFSAGLDEVLRIRPVSYKYNGTGGISSDKEHIGVIAQEFQKVAPYSVGKYVVAPNKEYDREGNVKSLGEGVEEYLSVNATSIRYMLVNAVKEQQKMIEDQNQRISELEDVISTIGSSESTNNTNVTLTAYDLAELEQNIPNPFTNSTSISYIIPTDTKTAQISVLGQNGQLLRTIDIDHVGKGTLNVNADELPSGTYSYQLIVDGRNIQTNVMVVTK